MYAAHLDGKDGKGGLKDLHRHEYLKVNIVKMSKDILSYLIGPKPELSLLMSSKLLYGLICIYNKKCDYVYGDVNRLFTQMNKPVCLGDDMVLSLGARDDLYLIREFPRPNLQDYTIPSITSSDIPSAINFLTLSQMAQIERSPGSPERGNISPHLQHTSPKEMITIPEELPAPIDPEVDDGTRLDSGFDLFGFLKDIDVEFQPGEIPAPDQTVISPVSSLCTLHDAPPEVSTSGPQQQDPNLTPQNLIVDGDNVGTPARKRSADYLGEEKAPPVGGKKKRGKPNKEIRDGLRRPLILGEVGDNLLTQQQQRARQVLKKGNNIDHRTTLPTKQMKHQIQDDTTMTAVKTTKESEISLNVMMRMPGRDAISKTLLNMFEESCYTTADFPDPDLALPTWCGHYLSSSESSGDSELSQISQRQGPAAPLVPQPMEGESFMDEAEVERRREASLVDVSRREHRSMLPMDTDSRQDGGEGYVEPPQLHIIEEREGSSQEEETAPVGREPDPRRINSPSDHGPDAGELFREVAEHLSTSDTATLSFYKLTPPETSSRTLAASNFYAVLALTKQRKITVHQHQPFSDIVICRGANFYN